MLLAQAETAVELASLAGAEAPIATLYLDACEKMNDLEAPHRLGPRRAAQELLNELS